MSTCFMFEYIVDELAEFSPTELRLSLGVVMQLKNSLDRGGIQRKNISQEVEKSGALRRIQTLFQYCLNNLDEIIESLNYVLLIMYIKEKNEAAALYMIKKGAKVNPMEDGERGPLDEAIDSKMTTVVLEMLRLQADPWESCFEALDDVLKKEPQPISEDWETIKDMMVDNLLSYCTDVATLEILTIVMGWKCTRAKEVLEAIDESSKFRSQFGRFLDNDLLSCDSDIFLLFLQKFSQELYDHREYKESRTRWSARAIQLAFRTHANMDAIITNLDYLLKSSTFSTEILNDLCRCGWGGFYTLLLCSVKSTKIPSEQFEKLADFLQNAGVRITTDDMDAIYATYGYESVLKSLLLKPVPLDLTTDHGTFARFYYDPKWTLQNAMKDTYFLHENNDLEAFLGYFARPELKEIALRSNNPSVALKAPHLQEIPRLAEFARDTVRKCMQVRNFQQLHAAVDRLPVPRLCAKILLFEERIY